MRREKPEQVKKAALGAKSFGCPGDIAHPPAMLGY